MKLRDPFDRTYEKGGFTYVSWSQVADRLDEAAPGWQFEIRQLGEDWCWGKLTIDGRTFENIGYAENATADWKKEALKDAVSDALKRCAAMAGVARYLYDKDAPVARQNGHTAPVAARPVQTPPRSSTAVPEDFDWEELLGPLPPSNVATMVRPVLTGTQAVTNRTELSEGEGFCPTHGLAWVLKPAGVSKTGAPYDPFYACGSSERPWCKEKPTRQWVEAHHP